MFVRFDQVTVFRRLITAMCTVPSSVKNSNTFAEEVRYMLKHATHTWTKKYMDQHATYTHTHTDSITLHHALFDCHDTFRSFYSIIALRPPFWTLSESKFSPHYYLNPEGSIKTTGKNFDLFPHKSLISLCHSAPFWDSKQLASDLPATFSAFCSTSIRSSS